MKKYRLAQKAAKTVLGLKKDGSYFYEEIDCGVSAKVIYEKYIILVREDGKYKIYSYFSDEERLILIEDNADDYDTGSVDGFYEDLLYQKDFDWYLLQSGSCQAIFLGEREGFVFTSVDTENPDHVTVSFFEMGLEQKKYVSVVVFGFGENQKILCRKESGLYDVYRKNNSVCDISVRFVKENTSVLRLEDKEGVIRKLQYFEKDKSYVLWFEGKNVALELNNAVLASDQGRAVLWWFNGRKGIQTDSASLSAVQCKKGCFLIEDRCWVYDKDNNLKPEWVRANAFDLVRFWTNLWQKIKSWF